MQTEPLTIPNGDVVLEAELVLPDGGAPVPGVAVCHPHPQYGGDMRNNVVVAIIQGLLERGIAALRFNFRGAGRSTGTYSEGIGEQEDALAAFAALREHEAIDPGRLAIAGYSFGANIALSLAPHLDDALGVAAVAPPLQGVSRPEVLSYAKPKLIIAGDRDSFAHADEVRAVVGRMEGEAHLARARRGRPLHGRLRGRDRRGGGRVLRLGPPTHPVTAQAGRRRILDPLCTPRRAPSAGAGSSSPRSSSPSSSSSIRSPSS